MVAHDSAELLIGDVARLTGLSVHAIRYYEREELMPGKVRRDRSGQRRFAEEDVEWLRACVKLRATGMPLPAIRQYVALVREGAGNEGDRLAILRNHERQVLDQLASVEECLRLVRDKIAYYESH